MTSRKFTVVLGTLCLLGILFSVPAQAGPGAFVGVNFPSGEFGDAVNTGYQIGGLYDFSLIPIVSLGIWGAYNHMGYDGGGGNFNSWEILATGKVKIPLMGLYGRLGLGFSNYNFSTDNVDSDRKTDFTWMLQAGWGFTMLDLTLSYHQISTEGATTNYLTLGAGVSF